MIGDIGGYLAVGQGSRFRFVEEEGHLYLVMQYAEGETFDLVIAREGRVSVADVVDVVRTLTADPADAELRVRLERTAGEIELRILDPQGAAVLA